MIVMPVLALDIIRHRLHHWTADRPRTLVRNELLPGGYLIQRARHLALDVALHPFVQFVKFDA